MRLAVSGALLARRGAGLAARGAWSSSGSSARGGRAAASARCSPGGPGSAEPPAQPTQQQHAAPDNGRQLHPQPALQVAPMQQYELVSEAPLHSRYLTVYDRRVRFCAPGNPAECRVLDFDVVGHPRANFCFAVTFPFHPYKDGRRGGEVTLIREYAQGPHALAYCLPTGGLDPGRHADVAECAARELSEEAWLAGGQWHRLLAPEHPGLPEVKWCMNRFVPFLVVDPDTDPQPGSRDAEEASMEVLRLPLDEFRRLMVSGEMLLPSITTAYMALDRLRELGLLDD
ncbi:hypothetical protein HT031_006270 [Scenedesmus sp. PABB004]|nr:hypothetical protein HT031_006270 [Scenedesmus sp. PABB004]